MANIKYEATAKVDVTVNFWADEDSTPEELQEIAMDTVDEEITNWESIEINARWIHKL